MMLKQTKLSKYHAVLVEDEQAVRLATTQTLELGGFSVQACSNASRAFSPRTSNPTRPATEVGITVV